MSLIKANAVQIGQSPTATQNFTLAVPSSPNGTIKLARGNAGATTQDVISVDASGNIDALVKSTGSTTARSLANRFADVVNVKDFGAVGNGVTIDSTAIQAAANAIPASGGVLYFPNSIYATNTPIFLKSNTKIMMYGATLLASVPWIRPDPSKTPYWANGYFMLTNVNHGTTIVDENIEVWGGTFDYRPMSQAAAPGGGRHAINFRAVRNVVVAHGTLYGGEDYTAFLRCDNTLVLGCSAYDYENCAYDHWSGAKNAKVIGCFGRSANTVQHVNFNALGDGIPNQVAENFLLQSCTFIHPTGGTRSFASIFLDPLGAGDHTVKNVIIEGCLLHNTIITARQNVQNVLIRGNQFFGTPGAAGVSPIFSYPDTGNTPDNIIVDGNVFHLPQTAAPNVAVIDLRGTNSRITNNKITGTSYSVPAFNFGSQTGIEFGNDYLGSAFFGKSVSASGAIRAANNQGFSVQDINGNFARWLIQTDNNMVFRGLNGSGGARVAWSWQQQSNTSFWTWDVPVRHNQQLSFGTNVSTPDVPITSYIEILDAAGNIRKLAVIS